MPHACTAHVALKHVHDLALVQVWDPLREKWPILAGKTDEELLEALKPIKAEYVDARFL